MGPAQRLIEIMPHLVKYCTLAKSKKVTEPTCKSFKDILHVLSDPLITSKLNFFVCIAQEVEPFLACYQTDRPMIPFLAADLQEITESLMKRIITEDALVKHKGALHTLHLNDNANFLDPSQVDIGFVAKRSSVTKKASDRQRYTFRMECRDFIKAMLLKIVTKTPIKSALVKSLGWLNPSIMVQSESHETESLVDDTLNILVNCKRIKPERCDAVKRQYSKFCRDVHKTHAEDFHNFQKNKEGHRLDELLASLMSAPGTEYPDLWSVAQQLLLLSHGQASVERGFSVNLQTTCENLSKEALKAKRLVLQAVREAGDPVDVQITKEMLSYASSARAKYQEYLEKEKERISALKRKAEETGTISDLKTKRQRLMTDAKNLFESADRLAEEAAESKKMPLLVESNTLRKRAKEIQAEVDGLTKELEKLERKK